MISFANSSLASSFFNASIFQLASSWWQNLRVKMDTQWFEWLPFFEIPKIERRIIWISSSRMVDYFWRLWKDKDLTTVIRQTLQGPIQKMHSYKWGYPSYCLGTVCKYNVILCEAFFNGTWRRHKPNWREKTGPYLDDSEAKSLKSEVSWEGDGQLLEKLVDLEVTSWSFWTIIVGI